MRSALQLALENLDLLAFLWFATAILLYRFVASRRGLVERSLVGAVQRRRQQWMAIMVMREPRIMDAMLIGSLGQGNAFFASTSAIAIGGLSALLGAGERMQVIMESLPFVAKGSALLWELKIILLIAIFVYAFFKYAWSFRLTQYAYIMLGATPILTTETRETAEIHADRTARLIGIAGEHANSGLRAYYYAIAAMGWFVHPLIFVLTTTWVMGILIRRDFYSRSLAVISDE